MQMFQELRTPDDEKKITYCHWCNQIMNNDLVDLSYLSDEAWFHLVYELRKYADVEYRKSQFF
jgi:hypothetical protein